MEVESEESEEEKPKAKVAQPVKAVKQVAKITKKVESDSSESDVSEDVKPPVKTIAKPVAAVQKKPLAAAKTDSDEESEEESEEEPKAKSKKVVPEKAAPQKAAPQKSKAKVEESEESEDSDDTPVKGKAATNIKAKQVPQKTQPKKKDSDSDEESEEEVKPQPKAKQQVKAKPVEEEEEEEEKEEVVEEKAPIPAPVPVAKAVHNPDAVYEVFIRGLSYQASEHDLREMFAECGEITGVNVLKDRDTGNSKGLAFVKFATEEGQSAAVEYNGAEHMGRSINIEKATPKEQRPVSDKGNFGGARPLSQRDPSSATIFVGNLSYGTTSDSLTSFFSQCGAIKGVRVAMDLEGNVLFLTWFIVLIYIIQPRGFGHVEFASPESVDSAIAKAGEKLDGRALNIDYSGDKKGGERGGDRGGDRGGN